MTKHYTNTSNPVDFPTSVDRVDEFINKYADFVEGMSDEAWEHLGESKLIRTQGNLLDLAEAGDFDVVVQGCNCFNTMGGGIAREIRERFPNVAAADAATISGDYRKLGTWTDALIFDKNKDPVLVVNAYTQYNMSQGNDVFAYTAFDLILQKLIHEMGNLRFGLPYIGMGLAGGDRETIMGMIEAFSYGVASNGGTVTLVEFGG